MKEQIKFEPFKETIDSAGKSDGIAMIPYYVRYAQDLNIMQKFLYGEISTQFDKTGKVYINKMLEHFSTLLDISEKEVWILLDDMSQKRYINCFIDEDNKQKGIFILRKRIL